MRKKIKNQKTKTIQDNKNWVNFGKYMASQHCNTWSA